VALLTVRSIFPYGGGAITSRGSYHSEGRERGQEDYRAKRCRILSRKIPSRTERDAIFPPRMVRARGGKRQIFIKNIRNESAFSRARARARETRSAAGLL